MTLILLKAERLALLTDLRRARRNHAATVQLQRRLRLVTAQIARGEA